MSIAGYDPNFIENNPWQTRIIEPDLEYIKDLALDIEKNGLLQIPIGRIVDGKVQLAFGHNRLKAFLFLKKPLMSVDLRELSDEQMAILAWSENEKRRDHSAIERARAVEKRIKDFRWTNRQCAEQLGIDHSTVSNILRLLKLPDNIQQALLEGKLTERQAEALLPIYDVPESVDRNIGPWSYRAGQNYISANSIGEIAIKKGWSSDMIRDEVNGYFRYMTYELKDAEFKLDQLFTEGNGIYCGLCKTCDKRMPSRNLCFNRVCFETKTKRVHQDYLQQASFVLGYPLDDPEKGGYPTDLPDTRCDDENRKKIVASKCPSLVLIYRNGADDFEAFPDVKLVCTKRNNSCTCIKGLQEMSRETYNPVAQYIEEADVDEEDQAFDEVEGEAEEIPTKSADEKVISSSELEEAARQARRKKIEVNKARDDIRAKLAARLLVDLNKMEPGAFYLAIHGSYALKNELKINKILASMAENGARRIISDNTDWNSIEGMIKYINRCLEDLNLAPFKLEEKPIEMAKETEVNLPII